MYESWLFHAAMTVLLRKQGVPPVQASTTLSNLHVTAPQRTPNSSPRTPNTLSQHTAVSIMCLRNFAFTHQIFSRVLKFWGPNWEPPLVLDVFINILHTNRTLLTSLWYFIFFLLLFGRVYDGYCSSYWKSYLKMLFY